MDDKRMTTAGHTSTGRCVDRRGFVRVAGGMACAAAVATGALGTAGAASAREAGESWLPQEWDDEADAIVIGYGAAGAIAAVELAEQGLTSLLLEKADREHAGGDCAVCGGYVMTSPDSAKPLTVDGYLASAMNGVDRDFAQEATDRINAVPDYLASIGVDLDTESFPGMSLAKAEPGQPRGQALYEAFEKAVESRSDMITVMYETPGIGLVQDPVSGEVLGVRAGSEDAPLCLRARRGVIVATGSYEADRTMTNAIHMPGLLFPTIGSPYNTGDGLKMLLKAGCKAQNYGKCLEYAAMASKAASEEAGTGITLPYVPTADSFIFVNTAGERFMDEGGILQHSKNDNVFRYNFFEGDLHSGIQNTRYPNAPAFMVFDQAMLDAGALCDVDGGGMGRNIHKLYTWSDDNQAEVERGWIVKGDTPQELAAKCTATDIWGNEVTVDADGLAQTITQYNEMCAAGTDEAFGRSSMKPLADGPLYAMEIIPATLYATGGAAHDINAQALDWSDRPIPRLYMAGLVGDPYTLHSSAVIGATMWAKTAADQIAGLDAWE